MSHICSDPHSNGLLLSGSGIWSSHTFKLYIISRKACVNLCMDINAMGLLMHVAGHDVDAPQVPYFWMCKRVQ